MAHFTFKLCFRHLPYYREIFRFLVKALSRELLIRISHNFVCIHNPSLDYSRALLPL